MEIGEDCILNHEETQMILDSGSLTVTICAICNNDLTELDPITQGIHPDAEPTSVLLGCGHAFHANCFLGWATIRQVCPLDNADIIYQSRDQINALQVDETSDGEPNVLDRDAIMDGPDPFESYYKFTPQAGR